MHIVVKKEKKKDRVVCQCFKAPEECKLELQLLYICKTLDLPTVDPSFPISHSCLLPSPSSFSGTMLCDALYSYLYVAVINSQWLAATTRRGRFSLLPYFKGRDLSAKNTLCNLFRGALSSSTGLMGC